MHMHSSLYELLENKGKEKKSTESFLIFSLLKMYLIAKKQIKANGNKNTSTQTLHKKSTTKILTSPICYIKPNNIFQGYDLQEL